MKEEKDHGKKIESRRFGRNRYGRAAFSCAFGEPSLVSGDHSSRQSPCRWENLRRGCRQPLENDNSYTRICKESGSDECK